MKHWFFALWLFAGTSHAAVILQYHHIDDQTPPITSTSPEAFLAHIEHIEAENLPVVSLAEIVATPHIDEDRRVAITFDDAYDNLLDLAIPTLVALNWPFTIFVATEYVGQPGYLTWQQLRKIESQGGNIANHTHTHLHMVRKLEGETSAAWLERLGNELEHAQRLLEANLKHPDKHFAYPYGEYDPDVLELIEQMGFVGFGQQSGAVGAESDFRVLPRFPLSGIYANLEPFKTKIKTRALPIESPLLSPIIDDDAIPVLELRFKEENLRFDALKCYGPGGETVLDRKSEQIFIARNQTPLPVGRSRYNCTMPVKGSDRFYWFSQLWMRKQSDGNWYAE